jgi:hypothetical protein
MTDEQRQAIISRLNGRNQVGAFEAAKAVWEDSDRRLERHLILTLKNGRRPFNRAAAAYAMQMVTTPRTIRALESVVKNKSERPRVRGEAAEALAHCHRRKSHDVLLRGLSETILFRGVTATRAIPAIALSYGTRSSVNRWVTTRAVP